MARRFTSPHAGYTVHVLDAKYDYSTGRERQIRGSIVADFLDPGAGGGDMPNPELDSPRGAFGEMSNVAVIFGGYFDVDEAARRQGWSKEEADAVADTLTGIATDPNHLGYAPDQLKVYSPPKPKLPWPTYDKIMSKQIPTLAEEMGLLTEAMTYETRTKNRPEVVSRLKERLEHSQGETELTAA